MAESLTNKTVRGVAWNSIDRIANYGISFLVSIVLARLLSPEDYGLIGLINIFIVIFNVILDGGLSTALIRREKVTETEYNTVFYSNLVVSVFLALLLVVCSPFISSFFKRPELIPLLRVMSLVLIINSLAIVQQTKLTREINFRLQTKISVIAHVGSGVIGIVLALMGFGVWALVAQQISSRLLATLLFWLYGRWMPRLIFSWNSFKELFGFGWKLLVSRVINSLWGQLYQAVIGKFYSPYTLGLYTRAIQYAHMFSSGVSDVVLKVSLPVMSSIQSEDERLITAARKIIKTTMFVTFVFMMEMAAAAKSLVFVLIGEKWLPCVPMLQIVCFNVMFNPLSYINENLLTVKGRSDKILILQIFKIVITIIPLLLGIFKDIYWMLIGSAVVSWLAIFLYTYYTNKYFNYSTILQIKDISPSFIVALIMAVAVYLLNFLPISGYILLPLQIIVGFGLIVIIGNTTKLEEYQYVRDMVFGLIKKKIKK